MRVFVHGCVVCYSFRHQAFEDMDPEQLMSGYHLAGGAHPGEHLAKARRSWFQQHLAELHRQSGSVIGHGGDGGLREKRAQITKKLLKLGMAPERCCSAAICGGVRLSCLPRACGNECTALTRLPPASLQPLCRITVAFRTAESQSDWGWQSGHLLQKQSEQHKSATLPAVP
jgi:hypothetical protein